ncbi:MAG: T9SS type A sorting domain-containing protein [Bacteroidetes bacterium]|nr:T9SS type A sorting domain-containing protein [Bacteroidota bacterium]
MKKKFTILLIINFIGIVSFAQIPNNSFENWTQVGTYMDPDGWGNLNVLTSPLSILTCTQGTPGNPGSYYLKLTSKTVVGTGIVPGIAVSGQIDPASFTASSGFSFNQRPEKLTGNWQYMAFSANDQGYIAATLTKWNAAQGKTDTVAGLFYALPGMVMSWAAFNLPFNYVGFDYPDTCTIILAASGGHPANNSYLWVDNLVFSGAVAGIQSHTSPDHLMTISSDPAESKVIVNIHLRKSQQAELSLYDVTGKIIKTQRSCSGPVSQFTFDTSRLPKGIYFLKLQAGSATETKKLVL